MSMFPIVLLLGPSLETVSAPSSDPDKHDAAEGSMGDSNIPLGIPVEGLILLWSSSAAV